MRSGISTQLGYMLAEQNDNMLHKPLSQLEAAELYREMKVILAEDAAQRKAATQFVSGENRGMTVPPIPRDRQPSHEETQGAKLPR